MEVMLIWLSRDQRSKARRTSFSATAVLLGSMFVRMCSQRVRISCSRVINCEPWLTDFFNSAMRVVRSRQLRSKGPRTNRSPTRNATAAMAMKASSCWRFLMFTGASWFPAEVETELQRRPAAAPEVIDFELGHFLRVSQLFEHFQKRL